MESFNYSSFTLTLVSIMLKIVSVLAVYSSFSYLCLTHPTLIWRSNRHQKLNNNNYSYKGLILGAHRGGSAERPEN